MIDLCEIFMKVRFGKKILNGNFGSVVIWQVKITKLILKNNLRRNCHKIKAFDFAEYLSCRKIAVTKVARMEILFFIMGYSWLCI